MYFCAKLRACTGNGTIRTDVLAYYIRRLGELKAIIRSDYHEWKFVSSSVLFVYDTSDSSKSPHMDMRLIDFAHTLPPDDHAVSVAEVGYLEGLENLMHALKHVHTHLRYSAHSTELLSAWKTSPLLQHLQHDYQAHHQQHNHHK